ncbi:MAG: M14 family zinc carboxypeptidase [Oligoflexus sp.]
MMRLQTSLNLQLAVALFCWNLGCSARSPENATNMESHREQAQLQTNELQDEPQIELASVSMASIDHAQQVEKAPPANVETVIDERQKQAERAKMLAFCAQVLDELPGHSNQHNTQELCLQADIMPQCESVEKRPIFHYDLPSHRPSTAKKVLVFAVVHGDELESGGVARRWIERLMNIKSRNSWRIVPVLNPDGMKRYTRTNANGVDLNRNFPSSDWDELALKWWKERRKSNPRQYPGDLAASEPETQCAMRHIDDFKPDFIVAVHTPYGVLDFDGPSIANAPRYESLPWVSLGTFPGSLGRYMWKDHQVPVLTVELKNSEILKKIDDIDALQDIAGTVAIRSADSL